MPWALVAVGAAVLVAALVSRRLSGTSVTAAMLLTALGVLAGPRVLDAIDTAPSGEVVRVLAEATLALVLFGDAAKLNLRALRHEGAVPARLLGLGLPLTIAAGTLAAWLVLPGVSLLEALIVAVLLAPTDAALGQAVVSDERVPEDLRQGLSVESGLNDGICVPVLLIALAAAEVDADVHGAAHAVSVVLEEIGYGLLAGVACGAAVALVRAAALRRELLAPTWAPLVPIAGTLLAYGLADAVGGSGFIAAFAGGMAYGACARRVSVPDPARVEDERFAETLATLTSAATFLIFGAVLLGPALWHLQARTALYAVLSLTLVRMVPVALALLGAGRRWPTVAFLGWFGPRGLASIVFAVIVVESSRLPHVGTILDAAYITVGASVLAHGLTAVPLTARFARWRGAG